MADVFNILPDFRGHHSIGARPIDSDGFIVLYSGTAGTATATEQWWNVGSLGALRQFDITLQATAAGAGTLEWKVNFATEQGESLFGDVADWPVIWSGIVTSTNATDYIFTRQLQASDSTTYTGFVSSGTQQGRASLLFAGFPYITFGFRPITNDVFNLHFTFSVGF